MNMIRNLVDQLLISKDHQEYLINGTSQMTIVVQDGTSIYEKSPFSENTEMYRAIQDFGLDHRVRLDPLRPTGGGVVDFGSSSVRWHTILPPVAGTGPQLSLRRLTWNSVQLDSFSSDRHLFELVERLNSQDNIFFSGETGSGKTTLLTLLLERLSSNRRVFIMESLAEIPILSNNWVRLTEQQANLEGNGAFSLSDALKESLRMRPDQSVLGEIRSDESKALFQLMGTAGQGVWATIHTSHPNTLLNRLSYLSGLGQSEWLELFRRAQPWFFQLQRKKPRIAGLYRFIEGQFEMIS